MFELVILDLDGTLVDSKKDITLTLNKSFKFFGLEPLSEELIAKHVGTGIKPLIIEYVPNEKVAEFQSFFENTYLKNIAVNTRLYSGWLEFFESTASTKKIILSNKLQKFCDPLASALGLNNYFVNVFGGDAFIEPKPSGFPILEILKLHGTKKNEALMVGDTTTDILSAKSAGIASCAVDFGYGNMDDIIKLNPEYTIGHPTELSQYFIKKL